MSFPFNVTDMLSDQIFVGNENPPITAQTFQNDYNLETGSYENTSSYSLIAFTSISTCLLLCLVCGFFVRQKYRESPHYYLVYVTED